MNRLLTAAAAATVSAILLALPAVADTVTATGTFTGASDHITTGAVSVVEQSDGSTVVILGEDFSLDGAPDPKVGFGVNGKFIAAADLGELTSKNGRQVYTVPANVDPNDFNEVYIWCEQFSVPLGVATLN